MSWRLPSMFAGLSGATAKAQLAMVDTGVESTGQGVDPCGEPEADSREPGRTKVSVVIPVKDDSAMLVRCLAALHSQSLLAEEIIVVDNGSSDDSALRAEAAGAIVIDCSDPGIPAASARGYDRASGDLILRLDADCVPARSWIEEVVRAFDSYPEAAALTGSARFIDGPAVLRTPLAGLYLLAYTVTTGLALGHRPLFGSNLAMRREAWESVGSVVHRDDSELHDDLDLSFHLGERHRILYLRSPLMGMSMRPFTSAGSFRRRTHRGYRTVTIHWPHDFPPRRWRRLATWGRERDSASTGTLR